MSTAISVQGGGIECLIDGVEVEDDIEFTSNDYIMTLPRSCLSSIAISWRNHIYILGGSGTTYGYEIYKFSGQGYELQNLNTGYPFTDGNAVVFDDKIHLLGTSSNNYQNYHYSWNGVTRSSASTLPYNFYNGSATVLENAIHIIGSGASDNRTSHYKWAGTSPWTSVSTLPTNIPARFCACTYNGELHLLRNTSHYKWNGSTWTLVSTIPNTHYGVSPLVVINGCIVLFSDNSLSYRNVFKWDGTTWTQIEYAPYNMYNTIGTEFNNEIHIMSGNAPTQTSTYHYAYNMNKEYHGWCVQYPALPYSFSQGCCEVYNNEIHLLGGSNTGTSTNHQSLNNFTTWSSQTAMPYDFYNGSSVIFGNNIHIFGSGTSSYREKHYKWNGSTWESVSTLPCSFNGGKAVVYEGEIHILGGGNDKKKHYKWNGSTWESVSTLPYIFQHGGAVIYNEEIHILGSWVGGNETLHYKWNGSTWESVSTLPYAFYYDDAVVYHNKIHIIGGPSTNNMTHYSWDGEEWHEELKSPIAISYGTTVLQNDYIFAISSNGWCAYNEKWHNNYRTYLEVVK